MQGKYWLSLLLILMIPSTVPANPLNITDMAGRTVSIPAEPQRIICIGPGTLRLIVYLQARDKVVGVESMEKRHPAGRPYWLAHPQMNALPDIGPGGPGAINKKPDMEAVLHTSPELIFATYMDASLADEVAGTLGIPVVVLSYGELSIFDQPVYDSLELAGQILNREARADGLIDYIEGVRKDLQQRTADLSDDDKPGVYVGGIGYRGAHGIESTQRQYIPLDWNQTANLASSVKTTIGSHLFVDKELLLNLAPDVIFIDGSGLALVADDYRKRPEYYHVLTAVKARQVYSLLPFNFYTTNIGTAMANAYAIGKVLYPSRFEDVKLSQKADDIYTFLVGKPVYEQMKSDYGDLGAVAPFIEE